MAKKKLEEVVLPAPVSEQVDNLIPLVGINADGASVSLQLKAGLEPWQALGLIETALVLVKAQYSSSVTSNNG